MTVTPCRDHGAADWIPTPGRPWHRVVTLGPTGFAASARLLLAPDPAHPGQAEVDAALDDDTPELARWRAATAVLARHTATAELCTSAVWEGWGRTPADPGARLWTPFPERGCFLFEGRLDDLGDADAWAAVLRPDRRIPASPPPDPAFLWPADRAWCITRDVDPHFAVVSASARAIDELLRVPGLDLVRTDLDEDPPSFA